jgi:hypothetical protein
MFGIFGSRLRRVITSPHFGDAIHGRLSNQLRSARLHRWPSSTPQTRQQRNNKGHDQTLSESPAASDFSVHQAEPRFPQSLIPGQMLIESNQVTG